MKQRGVTLIQMLSALAVAVLLTQLGVPAYARMSDDLHRAAAARDLAQALRSARSHALLQGQNVLVQPLDSDWGKGWRVLLEHNQQVLREQRLSKPMRIMANTGDQVKFSALGVPLGRYNGMLFGRLELCERTAATSLHRVVMASSGRISLRTGEPDNQSLCAGL
ncbi:MAG: GspH/FimT family pseudopilin [Candidatus Pseudomonas phytovorans]|uniref:Type II secretion system protein H n=1 Tax=Candidatus Pseudomonas phytovorans TaxID=3121377 RepID=A0AAJ6BBQ6_9PSED|nr:GspH/FimT family pseudopilin [Pseudomonas sp.]WEK30442.1 MAG: GspH/FimT family pseudopilin [Pseudomonas sp.]